MPQSLLALKSPLGDALLPIGLRGAEFISRVYEFEAEVVSERGDIAARDLLGQTVGISIDDGQGRAREFSGYCTRFVRGGSYGRFAHYRLTLRPGLWFLSRNADCRIFQDMTVPDIVKAVLAVSGKQRVESRLTASYTPWKYCVQYRETDLNFVSRLLEQEGIYYTFEHAGGNHTMVLYDAKTAHKPLPQPVLPFRSLGQAGEALRDHVRDWQHAEEYAHHRYSLNEFDYTDPNRDLFVSRLREGQTQASVHEIYDYPGEFDAVEEGERYVGSRIEEMLAQAETFEAHGTVFYAASGLRFRLAEHPVHSFNSEYLITSVTYDCTEPLPESDSLSGAAFNVGFTAIRAQRQFRPLRMTPKPIVQGVQTATVVGPAGEEIYTDDEGFGRVRVQFHWDRYGKRDDKSSCWVRVASPWANQNFGFVAIPRIGSEVVVSFEEGDPDRPLITGSVYNGVNRPPYALPANKTQSGLKTHTVKGGNPNFNELRFEDKQGSELVFLQAEKDEQVLVKNDRIVHVRRDQHENITGNAYLAAGRQLHEKIGSDRLIDVGGSVSVKAAQDTLFKSGMRFNADAGQEIHLKAGMNVTIEAGVSLTLKVGGNFVSINPAGVFVTGTMVMINSGGAAGSGSGAPVKSPREAAKSPEGTTIVRKPSRPPKPQTFRPSTESMKRSAGAGAAFGSLVLAPTGPGSGPSASSGRPVKTGLGDEVDKLAAQSPSLQRDMRNLQEDGWAVKYGPAGGGSHADRATRIITLDDDLRADPQAATMILAHEVGHATYPYKQDLSSRTAYVNGALADEGAATLYNIRVQREIIGSSGPNIGIAGNSANHVEYNAAYDRFLKDGNAAAARRRIGERYRRGEAASGKEQSYEDYYGSWYDENHPPKTK